MDVEIQILTHKDTDCFSELIKVFEEAFEWENFSPPTNTHLQRLLNNENFLVFVAKTNHNLIGGLTTPTHFYFAPNSCNNASFDTENAQRK
jgi:aminoglycoside 3-N-acetyltransferase I